MPIYEYRCENCLEITEAIRRMADKDQPIICEQCGSDKTSRIHSLFSAGKSQPETMSCPPTGCGSCPDVGNCHFRS